MKTFIFALIAGILLIACTQIEPQEPNTIDALPRFESGAALLEAFENTDARNNMYGGDIRMVAMEADSAAGATAQKSYSETNVQVQGVDEADIIKTDGDYIYAIVNSAFVIVDAYPADELETLSTLEFKDYYPQEFFINDDKAVIFGQATLELDRPQPVEQGDVVEKRIAYYPYYTSVMSVRIYDISDKEGPQLEKTIDFEGSYLTSRMIGDYAYFVVNTYPRWFREPVICDDIVPLYREVNADGEAEMKPIAACTDIGYIPPIQAENFITIASVRIPTGAVKKETIVGSGQNVYASLDNMYIAQTSWPMYTRLGELVEDFSEQTVITKFELDDGDIDFVAKGEVKGHILNQFSMDEYDEHFRIATTSGQVWDSRKPSMNNVYVLDADMDVVGELEDLAPGESIYSVRFMGKKGYVVTFKKVDPLFVIDLEDPKNPEVLGKLKIPGYSDYLHPYDETHIIGIGKDTVEAEEELVENRGLDFAWYQGLKMAIFDVSDVENPIEMHKVVIGDRGTESEALHNHKAFLFDREKNLLVLPITLAQIQGEKTEDNQYGEFVFQGAYVFDVTLDRGFELRGRVTHYDDDEAFKKSGYYFYGSGSIMRSLYIEDALYTLSSTRLQSNDLDSLKRLDYVEFETEEHMYPEVLY